MMAFRLATHRWRTGFARLSYAALVVLIFGLPVVAQAQEATDESQEQEAAEQEPQALEAAEEVGEEEAPPTFVGEVIVTGVRQSLTQSVEIKRESMPMVDAIVAEDVGKFPDANVVEALQRIPGVQVTNRGAGEVSTVSIRGLADVTTTVNGRNIFTTYGRSVALQDIPDTLVSRVDVYKTRSPEHISRGIAGGIDIHTFRPFDFPGFTFSAQARGIYMEQTEKVDPNVSFLVSNRWDTGGGEFGALLNVSFARTNWLDQGVHAGAAVPFMHPDSAIDPLVRFFPDDADWDYCVYCWTPGLENGLPWTEGSTLPTTLGDTEYVLGRDAVFQPHVRGERKRPAANLSLQWAPNDKSEYLFEAFYDGYRNTQHNSLFFTFVDWWDMNPWVEPTIYPGTNIIHTRYTNWPYLFTSGDVDEAQTDSYLLALGGEWDIGDNLDLKSEVVYQSSEYDEEFFAVRVESVRPRLYVDFNQGNGVPYLEYFDNPDTPDVDESDLTDASQWNMAQAWNNLDNDKGDAFTWTVDGDLATEWGPIYLFSFGLRYDDRSAEANSYRAGDVWLGGPTDAFPGLMGVTTNHFDGQAHVLTSWAIPTQAGMLANREALLTAYGYAVGDDRVLANEFNVTEKQTAAYVQADFSTQGTKAAGFIDGRFGFRALSQKTDMDFADPSGERATANNSNDVILPSVMLRWAITKDLMARLSYTETFNLPTFYQLNPYIDWIPDVTDIGYGTANGGNANLKPIESNNYDISLEWYFAEGSVIYGTWFKRDITNDIVDYRNVVQYDDPDDNPDRGLYTYILSQPDNTGESTLDGWEFGATWFPDLPGVLDGFGIQASLTLLDSERREPIQDEEGNVIGVDISPILGVSDTSYGVTLAYDRPKFNARLAWLWRDDFHDRDEAALFANPIAIWKSAEESLDFQATWYVTKRFALTFDAVNLTAPIYHENYGHQPKYFNFYNNYFSRSFALGVRYQFSKL